MTFWPARSIERHGGPQPRKRSCCCLDRRARRILVPQRTSNGNGASASANANGSAPNGHGSAPNGAERAMEMAMRARRTAISHHHSCSSVVDTDFRNVLGKGLRCVPDAISSTAAIFSFCVNILLLAMPIYLFQLSDRVYTSRSTRHADHAVGWWSAARSCAHVFLDMIRRLHLDAGRRRDGVEARSARSQRRRQSRAGRHQAATFSCLAIYSTCALSSPVRSS